MKGNRILALPLRASRSHSPGTQTSGWVELWNTPGAPEMGSRFSRLMQAGAFSWPFPLATVASCLSLLLRPWGIHFPLIPVELQPVPGIVSGPGTHTCPPFASWGFRLREMIAMVSTTQKEPSGPVPWRGQPAGGARANRVSSGGALPPAAAGPEPERGGAGRGGSPGTCGGRQRAARERARQRGPVPR